MENINFGIDLGTTNSGIGRYENGKVQVLKNPVGLREILPSVVSFKKGRTLVGDKAREQYQHNPENVFSAFKRKIGTSETFTVAQPDGNTEMSPIDLSAYVLKELQNYTHGTVIDSAVITIPASFDTIQSNATKQAGFKAGFKEVVLLQEPIAACLAYANLNHLNLDGEQKWLVYDFGGGTFDAALVYINQRELKIIDNKGNNFLGGVDIDNAFITEIIIPQLSRLTGDNELWAKISRREKSYEKLWHYLNYLAEEAKKQLSMATSTWIEIDFPELDMNTEFEINRETLNKIVKPKYLETEHFILELLHDNNLSFNDIARVVLVGGTTYIPFIKDSLREISHTTIDDSIDPTTAVIVGAAYYAGAHPKNTALVIETAAQPAATGQLDVKLSFETYSNDQEELIAFKINEPFSGTYRLTRTDGGFDSGMIPFQQTGSEFVSLIPKAKNNFRLAIYTLKGNEVFTANDISIAQGLYNISGQLLPEDICIELDNNDDSTYLEVIFKRNSVLPLSKTLYKTFSKSIIVNSDDKVVINVVEGKSGTMAGANLSIGYIELSGKKIIADLVQGTDLEIQVSMDESRGLSVELYIPTSGQEIKHSFHIATREVSVEKMLYDIAQAKTLLKKELMISNQNESYEVSESFHSVEQRLDALQLEIKAIANDHVTAEKYRLDERKRKLIHELDSLTRARDVFTVTKTYYQEKQKFIDQKEYATKPQITDFERILEREKELLLSNDKHLISRFILELKELNNKAYLQNLENFAHIFFYLRIQPLENFKSTENLQELFDKGDELLREQSYKALMYVVITLYGQLKDEFKSEPEKHMQQTKNIRISKMGLK